MIRLDFDIRDEATPQLEALASTAHTRGTLVRHLLRQWDVATQAAVGSAVRHRFTGKGPFPVPEHRLGVVTGRLRRAVRGTRPQVHSATGEISSSAGSNVKYFAVHEFGFRGRVQVRAHRRKLRSRKKMVAEVRGHSRRVNIPARAPLGTELKSQRGRGFFITAMRRAVAAAYQEITK